MFKFNASNFLDSFRPVYMVTKLAHIHFETINFRQQVTVRKLVDQFRLILTVILDVYLVSLGIRNSVGFLELTDSVLINTGSYASVLSIFLFSFSLPLWNRYKSAEMFEIFRVISDCDRNLLALGVIVDHRKHMIRSTIAVGSVGFFALAVLCFGGVIRFTAYWKHFEAIVPDNTTILAILRAFVSLNFFVCYCSLLLWSIRDRFIGLQEAVRLLPRSEEAKPLIRKIAEVHEQLCDTIQLFNVCYSGHIVYIMTTTFTYSIFCVFGLIHSYASSADDVTNRVTWNNMIYDVCYIQIMLQPIVLSSLIHGECKRSSTSIHKDICYRPYGKRTLKELRIASLQMYHRESKISFGALELDWILLYTMAGSFTTYIVILLQFDFANFKELQSSLYNTTLVEKT